MAVVRLVPFIQSSLLLPHVQVVLLTTWLILCLADGYLVRHVNVGVRRQPCFVCHGPRDCCPIPAGLGPRLQPQLPTALSSASSGTEYSSSEIYDSLFGVTLKIALDANGGVAELDSEESERFTSPASLDMVHRLRRDCNAVLVGRGTVQADNPSLTVRRVKPRCDDETGEEIQPLRVVLDPTFSLPLEQFSNEKTYRLFDDGHPTVVYHTLANVDYETLAFLDSVEFVRLPSVSREHNEKISSFSESATPEVGNDTESASKDTNLLSVSNIMSDLSQRYGTKHLMVEGGPITAQSFLRAMLVDRAIVVKAPVRFRKPLQSGITSNLLQDAGLVLLGTYELDSDVVECWSRPHLEWPSKDIESWP